MTKTAPKKKAKIKKQYSKIYRTSDLEGDANGLPRTGIFDLYDIYWMGHVCNLIKESCDPAPVGWRAGIAKILRETVLAPVDILIDRWNEAGLYGDEFHATDAFHKCIENVADVLLISGARTESNSYSTDETKELADELRNAWMEFIAYTAVHRMYYDLPRELLQRNEASLLGATERKKKAAEKFDREDFLEAGAALKAKYPKWSNIAIATRLASKYNRAPSYLSKLLPKK